MAVQVRRTPWSLVVMVLAVAVSSASASNILLVETVNIMNGVISGFTSNSLNPNVTILPPCVTDDASLLYAMDDCVTLMSETANITTSGMANILNNFTDSLSRSLLTAMKVCGYDPAVVSSVADAIQLLPNVQVINYTTASLVINGVSVYEDVASFVAQYSQSNLRKAGYYLGATLRDISGQNSSHLDCTVSTADSASTIWAMFRQQMGVFAGIDADEKVLQDLNTASEWSWCGGSQWNWSLCDRSTNTYTEDMLYDLNLVMRYGPATTYESWSNLDDEYNFFLTEINTVNTTEDHLVWELTTQMRQAAHREQRALDEVLPLWVAYANSTKNPFNMTYWMYNICTDPACADAINETNTVTVLYNELQAIYENSASLVLLNALDDLQDPAYKVNYTSEYSNVTYAGPGWDVSMLPSEWQAAQNAGKIQGGVYMDISSNTIKQMYCTGDVEIPSGLEQNIDKQGLLRFNKNGTWHDFELDYTHENFTMRFVAKSFTLVRVQPKAWFDPAAVWRFRNYTDTSGEPASYWFDPYQGSLSSIVSGLLIASDVTIDVTSSEVDYTAIEDSFGDADAVQFGPFFASGFQYSASASSMSFKTHQPPFHQATIVGYVIKQLPYDPSAN